MATIDADDLWRPTKLAKQMEALHAAGDAVGLVYTWFAVIDTRGRGIVIPADQPARVAKLQEWLRAFNLPIVGEKTP